MFAVVDYDAFFASVEQLRLPFLRGKPVIVGSGCVASCSYEARRYGVRNGMRIAEALRLCPEGVVLRGDYHVYRCFAAALWRICSEFAPQVEGHLDGAVLDMRGVCGWDEVAGRLEALRKRVKSKAGLSVSVGVGASRLVAQLACRTAKPDRLRVVRPDETVDFVAGFDVAELPGVGEKRLEVLRDLGVGKVGDLRRLGRQVLVALFGGVGEALWRQAWGQDACSGHAAGRPRQVSRETGLDSPTTDAEYLRALLHYLLERACMALRRQGMAADKLALRLQYEDGYRAEAATRIAPTDMEGALFEAGCALLERLFVRRVAVRRIGVALSVADAHGQRQLFALQQQNAAASRPTLMRTVDALRRRFGWRAIVFGSSINLLRRHHATRNGLRLYCPSLAR